MKKILVIAAALFVGLTAIYFQFINPKKTSSSAFTSPYASLSNSRMSYKASVATGTSGSPTVTIDTDSADQNTNHLFPNDTICFVNADQSGCIGNTTYTVANIVDSTHFTTTANLADNLATTDFVVATQSGTLTLSFTTATEIPISGKIVVTIPSVDANNKTNDTFPDTGSITTSGFDLNGMANTDVAITGCTPANWGTATVTPGGASSDSTISFTRSSASCAASTAITITIDSTPGLVNPAPISGHTQGAADSYQINIESQDASTNQLDSSDVTVSPIEGVFISATINESLSLTIAGVASSQSTCGLTTDITTTAYSVPWGTIALTDTFYEGSQTATVSTNANNGYSVYIEETDQMGLEGATCTGTAPSAGEYTFSGATCIRDTVCSASTCSESAGYDWTVQATYPGIGFSVANVSGTDASFVYNSNDPCTSSAGAGTFCARQMADTDQGGETRAAFMTNAGAVAASQVYVCYRISVTGTQPAGYYYNTVRYTAVATF